jgi:hypothetical protein
MRVAVLIACLSSAAASQQRAGALGPDEQQSLAALEQSGLEQLSAASAQAPARLSSIERAHLARLQSQNAELDALRAGEITDHEIKLILITAAVVVVIALLL